MLSFLLKEEVGLEEALFWTEGKGDQGYQLLDNYLVRVLGGQSTWELAPGAVGEAEFHNAKIALGKFEVLLRADCLAVDLPLLGPYIGRVFSAHNALEITSAGSDAEVSPVLTPGPTAESLIRRNRWDLQLWDYAESLIMARSTTLDSYLCSKQTWATKERQPGTGRRAAVFNSPDFHATSLAMFSCVLVSWGFHVTAIVQKPQVGFEELLPCPQKIISLEHALTGDSYRMVNSSVSQSLGLPAWAPEGQDGESGPRKLEAELAINVDGNVEPGGRERKLPALETPGARNEEVQLFDVSVLCTIYKDLEVLFSTRHPMDPRLVDALLWNPKVTIWNVHSVERALADGSVPPEAQEFARETPSADGRVPPPTFLTVFGEHVETWERWLEQAYEGWGERAERDPEDHEEIHPERNHQGSNLGGLFRRPGVVYPIHPTGHMRVPRPSGRKKFGSDVVEGGRRPVARFIVQGKLESVRRDYQGLFSCFEEMCLSGRGDFEIEAVGSSGSMLNELDRHPCTSARYKEGRDLRYSDFYSRISAGHFVVTATAGHDYEFDRATSSVPTALLLERPLVMSSALLDAYPCLKNSRVHSMVANDDLCLNLQAAYDLTQADYDEMELEARDCKLRMWKQTRETVAEMVSGWVAD
ncbi:unnamed protein product [Ascophyllum nodosum]